ncbi:transcription factor HIVEP2a [Leucoraja erinacea]|uniref:transcription factor HIVEP2a n=1 Tax=Leucoraja erinaceus TaxID=7782 RepID=UPI00245516A5|nr:transcription factor HIVEP2a [Leucoraja erinacea]XP_055495120.1 transcription factor HIVEP2a [Leucoraja erinacea]XP_055495121.1 transcription factor HIVEP2a [Leucoraja erinacea]XP_055495122.1 transcription factor HIVEP2a [Leucoraja erinacea]XP_055495124.1 transcription factor HIVEP2a [Leucoraja erinacea]XP_055495125.1 transcription factor HIVEP2a [Leucoraja erinacea]
METKRSTLASSRTAQEAGGSAQGSREWTPLPRGQPNAFAEKPAPGRTMEAVQPYYRAAPIEAPPPPPPPAHHPHLLPGPYHYPQPPFPAFPSRSGTTPSYVPEGRSWQSENARAPESYQARLPQHHHHHQQQPAGKKAPGFRHYPPVPREEALVKERKVRKPGRHICHYCGRACAKPSVLKKHIRSHTGERPYPCIPCGFSFKTKSNLYKHRKSHAHAIKAGLVPPAAEQGCEGGWIGTAAPELPSDGDESTDTDEEVRLRGRPSPRGETEAGREGDGEAYFHQSSGGSLDAPGEEPSHTHPHMKVPILIVPRASVGVTSSQTEAPVFIKAEPCRSPVLAQSYGGQHAIKQKLALRLSEKRGQDSEQSLNLLSPHSKGSTDSGYFSRSESAEQQASPPNTNAKSYAEIIFGKFARRAPRTVVANMTAQEAQLAGLKEKAESLPRSGSKPDIEKLLEEHIIQVMTHGEALMEPGQAKARRFFLPGEDSAEMPLYPDIKAEVYRLASQVDKELLGLPADAAESSPLIRSNSMPITPGSGLGVPQVLRGSHSFDERMASPDDVFHSGSAALPQQRCLLKRQTAIELLHGPDAHSPADDPEAGHGLQRVGVVPKVEEGEPIEGGQRGQGTAFECEACGVKYQIWDNFEAHRKFYCSPAHGPRVTSSAAHRPRGESGAEYGALPQAPHHKPAHGPENLPFRKRRKEKSVGDEDELAGDYGSPYSGSSTSPVSLCDSRAESLEQEPVARATKVAEERGEEEGAGVSEHWPASPQASRRPGGNEISVIQHTNSLSRPSSFERTESMEVTPADPTLSDPQPESAPSGLATSPQPKLVRQRNIQVPEIRVTEEPDKPDKEQEPPAKEPEKITEEFQWPQRSETLSQLPAEKLPPKKKRLRLADLEYSSGDSSFESGTLSRSPSQESNWSHSSSLSLSLDRDEGPKAPDLGRAPAEYLTVPYGASGPQQKEMRRSASEQTPCQPCVEMAEARSKSFDYGSLSAGPGLLGLPIHASSPVAMERRKCFLVRQATLSQYSESPQTEPCPEPGESIQLNQAYPLQAPWLRSPSPGIEVSTQPPAIPLFPGPARLPGPAGGPEPPSLIPYGPWRALPSDPEGWPDEGRLRSRPESQHVSSPRASPQHSPSRQGTPALATTVLAQGPTSLLVPVRIEAYVPSYGSVTYTSVSHATASCRASGALVLPARGGAGVGRELSRLLAAQRGSLLLPPWKLPLPPGRAEAPTSEGPSSSSAAGGSKRVLSPASSLELVLESQRQKRVKEEKICGQMMEKLSLRESTKPAKPQLVRQRCTTELRDNRAPPSPQDHWSRHHRHSHPDEQCSDVESGGGESPLPSDPSPDPPAHRFPISMVVQVPSGAGPPVGGTLLLADATELQQFLQFPSLRSNVTVSWCFLNYTKPSPARQTAPTSSIYAAWCVSSYNPNPPGTPTKVALALLRSRQKTCREIYITSAVGWPSAGKLVASSGWKQRLAQIKWYESSQQESDRTGRKTTGSMEKEREKMDTSVTKDLGTKMIEPTRIKIFDGGYKSNEDYVYVRGRGRGKYICEECGIRCKKPSMLKKHIRTHTDLRPFMCKFCNFAFKTKGNLTKHMKSKAHTKKCLELGIAINCMYNTDTEETGILDETEKDALNEVPVLHQFSDPEDTDGAEEEGDEDDDDDDDDDDDRQGDSTPTTRSRSTSPLAHSSKPHSVTFSIASASSYDVSHSSNQSSLISYLVTVPRIQVTQLIPPSYTHAGSPLTDYQRHLHNRLIESVEYKDRLDIPATAGLWPSQTEDGSSREDSSREMSPSGDTGSSTQPSPAYEGSPGRDASPTSRRYLSPRRDLSPRPHLSPRREISPLRHRSPKRETHLSDWSPKRDASPHSHFLPRREISSARQVSPAKDHSPRRELSPRRDYRERRHVPMIRATLPRRGSSQSEYVTGQYMQHPEMNLRQSWLTPYDSSRPTPWPWYPSENAQGDPSHSVVPEAQTGCLFTHLPLHSQQQARAPYQMIPIGGIQMVQSGPPAFPGNLPASQLPLRGRRREESIIDEATHCVIESIKEMDIFSKAEEVSVPSPMAVSPPRHNFLEGSGSSLRPREGGAMGDEACEDHALQSRVDAAREFAARSRADEAAKAFERLCQPEKGALLPPGAEHFSGARPARANGGTSFPRQHASEEGPADERLGNSDGSR